MTLAEQLLALHAALDTAALPHAFGGALALAWCTERARGTIDIDVNVFVGVDRSTEVFAAMPAGVVWTAADVDTTHRDGQVRLWWGSTPIDMFLDTTEFHRHVAQRLRHEPFGGVVVPFLDCSDLAVFKAFFGRTKDWADLEEMEHAGTLDIDRVVGVIVRYIGADDERVARLRALRPAR